MSAYYTNFPTNLREIVRSHAVKAAVLTTVFLTVTMGAASVGALLQSHHDNKRLNAKHMEVARLNDENKLLINQVESIDRNLQDAASRIRDSARDLRTAQAKAEFLDRYLAYKSASGEASRNALVKYVCVLLVNSQTYNLEVAQMVGSTNIERAPAVSHTSQKQVASDPRAPGSSSSGIPVQKTSRQAMPLVNGNATAPVLNGRQGRALLAFNFGDGRPRILPTEIAEATINDPNCKPRNRRDHDGAQKGDTIRPRGFGSATDPGGRTRPVT